MTGHRDLRDEDRSRLAASVDAFFVALRANYPNSEVIMLSSLAAGADRLVARCGLERKIPFVAVLPMPASDYRADFPNAADLAEFDDLLERAVRVVELPWPTAVSRDAYGDPATRNTQYAAVGSVLAANAAIVLALWNGHASALPGGTADVVRMAREAARPPRTLLAPLERPLAPFVYHIVTPRVSQPVTVGEAFSHPGLDDVDSPALHALHQQDRWNRDARAYLREAPTFERLDIDLNFVSRTFGIADALAIREQLATHRAFARIYRLATLATLCFEAYIDVLPQIAPLLYVAVSITVGGAIAYAVATKRKAADNFQDYRALAEGLRIQEAWLRAGIVSDVGDHYRRRHRSALDFDDAVGAPAGKLDWIRRTVRVARQFQTLGAAPDAVRTGADFRRSKFDEVRRAWIVPQAAYFARAAERKRQTARRYRIAWKACAVAAAALTVALTVAVSIPGLREAIEPLVKPITIFAIGAFGVVSALLQSYAEKRAFSALAKQYETMHRTFAHAADALGAMLAGEFHENEARALVLELGTEALAENAEWVIAMRDRPLEMILTG